MKSKFLKIKSIKHSLKISTLKFKILFAYLLICLFAFVPKSQAQSLSLSLFPPITQISANPPTDVKAPLTIQNLSDQDDVLTIEYKPFRPSDSANGDIEYLSDNESFGPDSNIFSYIKVLDNGQEVKQITLSPQQKKDLVLEVNLPKDEKPADYYFSVLFVSNNSQTSDSSYSNLIGGIATHVLLSIGPAGDTRGQIDTFSTPFFTQKGPTNFSVKIKNDSSHFISPNAVITIQNMFGQTVGKVDLLPVNVLAGTSRILPAKEGDNLNPQAVWPEKFLLGFYKANLTVSLSDSGPILRKSITFLAFPLEYLFGIIIIIIIVAAIVIRAKKQVDTGQIGS